MSTDAVNPLEHASLEQLVRDIGPMPTTLACDYIQHAANEVASRHERGEAHGRLTPSSMLVGPLVESSRRKTDGSPIRRPSENAILKLLDGDPQSNATLADDVRDLARSLCFLLTAREQIASTDLVKLRPDLPPMLVALILNSLNEDASQRPNLETFRKQLNPNSRTSIPDNHTDTPQAQTTEPDPMPSHEVALGAMTHDLVEAPSTPSHEWIATPVTADATASTDGFRVTTNTTNSERVQRRRELTPEETRQQLRFWAKLGIGIWILSIPLWYVFLTTYGCIGREEQPSEEPTKTRRR